MISKRILEQWRKEALTLEKDLLGYNNESEFTEQRRTLAYCIIKLTQELLDTHLMKGKN